MHQNHADDRKIDKTKPTIMAGLRPIRSEAGPSGRPAGVQKRGRGIDQSQEIPAETGVNDIEVEEQVPAAEEQPIQEERQQEQPGRAVLMSGWGSGWNGRGVSWHE